MSRNRWTTGVGQVAFLWCLALASAAVAQNDRVAHRGAAKVKVPELHPEALVDARVVIDIEGRRLCSIQQRDRRRNNLDVASCEVRVRGSGRTASYRPLNADDIFGAETLRGGVTVRVPVGIERDLCQSISVTQVDEDQTPMVPPAVDPTMEHNFITRVRGTQIATRMSSFCGHHRPREVGGRNELRLIRVDHWRSCFHRELSIGSGIQPIEGYREWVWRQCLAEFPSSAQVTSRISGRVV